MIQDDTSAISNVLFRYALAVDTMRFDLFDSVFTPDARCDYGADAVWTDVESLKRDFNTIHILFQSTQHMTTNVQAQVNGDAANAFSYVHCRFIREMPDGRNMCELTGWYDDVLVRSGGVWRIKKRTNRLVWAGGNVQVMQTMPDVPIAHTFYSLSGEEKAGNLEFLNSIKC